MWSMRQNEYVADRIKPDNEQIYYIVDTINDAINEGRQISFQYYDYTGLEKKVLKNKGEGYKLSPYHLLWNGDYYYVIGYSEKKGKVVTFRVDRIAGNTGKEIANKNLGGIPLSFYFALCEIAIENLIAVCTKFSMEVSYGD